MIECPGIVLPEPPGRPGSNFYVKANTNANPNVNLFLGAEGGGGGGGRCRQIYFHFCYRFPLLYSGAQIIKWDY